MTKNIPHYIHEAFILHRDSISKFFIDTAYEFLAGLFDCYHSCFKVSPVTLRDGENQAVSWGRRECGGGQGEM